MKLFRRTPDGSPLERFRAAFSADPGAVGAAAWSADAVYVSITGQLATLVVDLPPGTPIDSIKLR